MGQQFFESSSYAFSVYSLPVLAVGVLAGTLGIATLIRERGSSVSLAFAFMQGTVAVWLLSFAAMYSSTNAETALGWTYVMYVGLSFIPTSVLCFAMVVTGRLPRARNILLLCGVISAINLLVGVTTDLLVSEVRHFFWGYYPISGVLAPLFITFQVACQVSAAVMLRKGQRAAKSSAQRLRLGAIFFALCIAYLAMIDFVPSAGVEVYPAGWAFEAALVILATRAIWRYRLLGVTSEAAANQIIATMADAVVVVDTDGIVRVANQAAADILGVPRDGLLGKPLGEVGVGPFATSLNESGSEGIAHSEVTYGDSDAERTVIVSSSLLRDRARDPIGTVLIAHDISERKQAEQAVRQSEALYRTLVETSPDSVIVTNPSGVIVMANKGAAHLLGFASADELRGKTAIDFVVPDDQERLRSNFVEGPTKDDRETEFTLRTRIGAEFPAELRVSRIRDDAGELTGFMAVARDITERRRAEDTIRHLAFHDALTGLANRSLLVDELVHATNEINGDGLTLAVLYMDLDGMKGINDALGHSAGDEVLRATALRVRGLIRQDDVLARVGGDEFVLMLPRVRSEDQAKQVAERILESVREPFIVNGNSCHLSVSIGIAFCRDAGQKIEAILGRADAAMYEAKARGGDYYAIAGDADGGGVPVLA